MGMKNPGGFYFSNTRPGGVNIIAWMTEGNDEDKNPAKHVGRETTVENKLVRLQGQGGRRGRVSLELNYPVVELEVKFKC